MTRRKTRKRSGPLFRVPEPQPLRTLDDVRTWAAGIKPARQRLDEFLRSVLEATATGDRQPLLERAQAHARRVHRGLAAIGEDAADARLLGLVDDAVLLGQAWQRFYLDAAVRELVRTGEAVHSNPTRNDKRDALIFSVYEKQAPGQRMRGTLRELERRGVELGKAPEKTVQRAVRKGRKKRRDI